MKKIAIVDDSRAYIELITDVLTKESGCTEDHFEIDSFQKASSLLYELEDGNDYDIYFLDIEMPEMNGLELAREIREKNEDAYLIFITSHMEFAIDGYEVEAYQYILKSMLREKLPQVIEKILEKEEAESKEGYYQIITSHRYEKFRYQNIISIYKDGKNSVFETKNGIFRERKTLNQVFKELPKEQFVFADRGRIVNIACVASVKSAQVVMSNGEEFAVSRSQMNQVRKQGMEYWSR